MDADFYNRYYKATEHSQAHSRFCREVFGVDLCQHGFADVSQLRRIMAEGRIAKGSKVLDVGCGNGMIAEFISDQTSAALTGIDDEPEAVRIGLQRTVAKRDRLVFEVQDLNNLPAPSIRYDAILLIDTIYFSSHYERTIADLRTHLAESGRMLFLYSIGPALLGSDTFQKEILEARNTPLADALQHEGLDFFNIDLTRSDHELALHRKAYLEGRKADFERDGIGFIWENRMGDSTDIIKAIEKGLHRRYLYVAAEPRN